MPSPETVPSGLILKLQEYWGARRLHSSCSRTTWRSAPAPSHPGDHIACLGPDPWRAGPYVQALASPTVWAIMARYPNRLPHFLPIQVILSLRRRTPGSLPRQAWRRWIGARPRRALRRDDWKAHDRGPGLGGRSGSTGWKSASHLFPQVAAAMRSRPRLTYGRERLAMFARA